MERRLWEMNFRKFSTSQRMIRSVPLQGPHGQTHTQAPERRTGTVEAIGLSSRSCSGLGTIVRGRRSHRHSPKLRGCELNVKVSITWIGIHHGTRSGGVRRALDMGLRRLGGRGFRGKPYRHPGKCGSYAAHAWAVAALSHTPLASLARRRFGSSGPTARPLRPDDLTLRY